MIGAESLVRTLLASGVDTCFANPGTSEMHFVAALDRARGMRCVLGLFEGVVTGAADGYGRIKGTPAATLLHCGPGLANGLANLHNAERANSPIVNIVGDQATYHAPLRPPLTTDTEGWARPVSRWVRKVAQVQELGVAAAEAVQAARTPPFGIATLILPSDVSWNDGGVEALALAVPVPAKIGGERLREAARSLASGEPTVLLLGHLALSAPALGHAHRIAAKTGAKLMAPTFNGRIARGVGRYPIRMVPYVVDLAVEELAGTKHLILAGAGEPVTFFAYPGKPGIASPRDAAVHELAGAEHDLVHALAALADELNCPPAPQLKHAKLEIASGPMSVEGAAQTLAALLPDHAILIDEAITLRAPFFAATANAPPHDWLQVPGGAIGGGLPLAVGAAIAAPDRRVVVVQADGSAMYTVQALWSYARENLDVTTIILSNRKYAILLKELAAVGAVPGPTALGLFELDRPNLDWVGLAESQGVEAARAETLEVFVDLLRGSLTRKGPFLIELIVE
ncbi:MAG: acetolactate synthase large subunit [Alphaproteobacteria bacterium]|nr:acetolactate synthase large subunit [Alphaproteobacteria bacterium]